MTSLSEPDNFKYDYYSWAGNQGVHLLIGLMAYCYLQWGYYGLFGEFATRWVIFSIVAVAYASWELKWKGGLADSLEDACFVVAYGAGIPMCTFREVQGGLSKVSADFNVLMIGLSFVLFHALLGVLLRVNNAKHR